MATDNHTTIDRRHFIAGAAAVPAIAMTAAAPALAGEHSADRSAWDSTMARYLAADKECDAAAARFDAADKAFVEAYEKIPHITLRPDPYTGRLNPISTADERLVLEAQRAVIQLDDGSLWIDRTDPHMVEHYDLMRELAAAEAKRDAKAMAIADDLGCDRLENELEAIADRVFELRNQLIAMPAPDGEALRWKLDYLFFTNGQAWEPSFIQQTVDDSKRLLVVARQQ